MTQPTKKESQLDTRTSAVRALMEAKLSKVHGWLSRSAPELVRLFGELLPHLDARRESQLNIRTSPVRALMEAELLRVPRWLNRNTPEFVRLFCDLLPHLNEEAIRRFLPRFAENALRNDLSLRLQGLGRQQFVHSSNADELLLFRRERRPVICAFAHIGPPRGVVKGLVSLGVSALGIQNSGGQSARFLSFPGVELWQGKRGSPETTLFLKHAVDRLREGGVVFLALDGHLGGNPIIMPCLGRQMPFSRGMYTLQKISGAALIMVKTQWRPDHEMECIFEPALTDPEQCTPEYAANWLEARILEDPALIRIHRLKSLLDLQAVT